MTDVAQLGITVTTSGAKQAKSDLDALASSAAKAETSAGRMERQWQQTSRQLETIASTARLAKLAVAAVIGSEAIQMLQRYGMEIARAGENMKMMQVRIEQISGSTIMAQRQMAALSTMADKVGISLDAAAQTFQRIGQNADALGATDEQITRMVETVAKLGKVSGTSLGEMQGALVQLGQALASGTLQGDELRSILEQMPALAKAIATNMQVTTGRLREMGSQGELTGDKVFKAILAASKDADEQFAKLPDTMEAASARIENAFQGVLAEIDKTIKSSDTLTAAMNLVAKAANGVKDAIREATPSETAETALANLRKVREELDALEAEDPRSVEPAYKKMLEEQFQGYLKIAKEALSAAAAVDAEATAATKAQEVSRATAKALADRDKALGSLKEKMGLITDAEGVMGAKGALVSKTQLELATQQNAVNAAVAAGAPNAKRMAAGLAEMKAQADPLASALRGIADQINLLNAAAGAERDAMAQLQAINTKRRGAGEPELGTDSEDYKKLVDQQRLLATTRVQSEVDASKKIITLRTGETATMEELDKRIAKARANGNQALAVRLETEQKYQTLVASGVSPAAAAAKVTQEQTLALIGLTSGQADYLRGLDQNIAAQKRLAEAQGQGAGAVKEAEIQNRIASEQASQHAAANSALGQTIEAKIRAEEKWKQTVADGAALKAAEDELEVAKLNLEMVNDTTGAREEAVRSIEAQRRAVEMFGSATSETAVKWLALQKQIADTNALTKFQTEVNAKAKELSTDITQAMFDGVSGSGTSILAWWRKIVKRMALEIVSQKFVMPIVTTVVGSVPSLFGINSPAGAGGQSATGSTGGILDLFSSGSKLFTAGNGSLSPGLDAWAQSNLGFGQIGSIASAQSAWAGQTGLMASGGGLSGATDLITGIGMEAAPGLMNGGSALAGFSSMSNVLGIAGAVLPGLMSGNYVQAGMGGLGAAIGTAILPGIGTMIGGMLGNLGGGLFGGKKKGDIPAAAGEGYWSAGTQKYYDGKATTDNKGDMNTANQIVDALKAFGDAAIGMGGVLKQDLGWLVESKNGRFQTNQNGNYGSLDEAVIALLRGDVEAGKIEFADGNTRAGVLRSKATTAEDFMKDVQIAKDFERTIGRMRGGVSSASAAIEAMNKNAEELGKKGAEEIVKWRDKVLEMGLTNPTDIIEPLQTAVRTLAGLSDVEEPMTGLAAIAEQVKLNFAALKPVMSEVGFTAEQQQGMYDEMLAKARKTYLDAVGYTKAVGTLAIEQVRDPNARLDIGNTLRGMGLDPDKFSKLAESIGFMRAAADAGSDNGFGVTRTQDELNSLLTEGRITQEQYSAGIQLIVTEMERGLTVAEKAKTAAEEEKRLKEEAAQAAIAAAEEAKRAQEAAAEAEREKAAAVLAAARATRDFNADLLSRRQTLMGDANGAAMTSFDLSAAQAIEAAQAAGQDVIGLRAVLAAERAQTVYDQAVADYREGLSRQASALEEANAALKANIDLAKGFRQAYDALALTDASPLDGMAKLEEARRQFTEIASAYSAATDDSKRTELASQLQSLGTRRIELAQAYYASSNSADYEAVRALFNQLGVSPDSTQTQIDQNEKQIDAIRAAQKAAESIGQKQLGSLESLLQTMNGAKATLDATKAQLAAMPAPVVNLTVNGTTTTSTTGTGVTPILTPEQQYYAAYADVAKAGVNAAQHFAEFGSREGRERFGLTLTRDQEYLARYADVAAAVVAGAFSSGQQHYDLYGQYEGRKYAQGGFIPLGQIGMAGETGKPELLFGPAYVANPEVTARMMGRVGANDSDVVAELRAVKAELQSLRAVTAAGAMQVVGVIQDGNANTANMAATSRREAAAPKVA